MEIILAASCRSLTGSIATGYGYAIKKQGKKFISKQNSRGSVPAWGRLAFIIRCAELAQGKLTISDVRLPVKEFRAAILEAGKQPGFELSCRDGRKTLNAADVLYYQQMYNL